MVKVKKPIKPDVPNEAKERARYRFKLMKQLEWELKNKRPYWQRGLDEAAIAFLLASGSIKNPDKMLSEKDIEALPEMTDEERAYFEYLEQLEDYENQNGEDGSGESTDRAESVTRKNSRRNRKAGQNNPKPQRETEEDGGVVSEGDRSGDGN